MLSASSSDWCDGPPAVSAKFWSKSLNPFVSVKKVQIVIDGITIGNTTFVNDCHEVAPSILAASSNEIGKIANGAEVDVISTSPGQYWYVYVPSLNQEGYVNSEYLR